MPVDADRISKPLRKLHKLLADPPKELSPEEVHGLRTRCYRAQSTLRALGFEEERRGSALIAAIEAIRKKAGKVRDADVLTSLAARLADQGRSDSLIQLVEELGVRHDRFAARLEKTIHSECRGMRNELKRYRKWIEKQLAAPDQKIAEQWSRNAMARSVLLSKEIAGWPKLRADNLHPFRLKVKELRVVSQLSPAPEQEFVDALKDVKDAAGEWHDWSELAVLAGRMLSDQGRNALVKHIASIREERLQNALTLATRLRRKYFGLAEDSRGARKMHSRGIRGPALEAAARIAA